MKQKRGSFADPIALFVMVFVLAVLFVVFLYMADIMRGVDNTTMAGVGSKVYDAFYGFDSFAVLFVVFMGIALVFSTMLLKTHPIFFGVMFLINIALVFFSLMLSNVWVDMFTGNQLTATAASMTQWTAYMVYMPVTAIVISIITAIALFMRGGE